MRRSDSEIQARLDELAELCRDHGLTVTPQRTAIYRALLRLDSHPDAEALFAQVREELPNLSLATVYKSIEALTKLGVVRELTPLHETARFDANLDRHHHLLCTRCKKVVDLYDGDLDAIAVPEARAQGFRVSGVRVQVEGTCPECLALDTYR